MKFRELYLTNESEKDGLGKFTKIFKDKTEKDKWIVSADGHPTFSTKAKTKEEAIEKFKEHLRKINEGYRSSRLNESEDLQRTFYSLKDRMNALEKNLNGPIEEVADKIYIVAFTAIRLMGKILYEHPELKSEYDEERKHLITILQKQK